MDGMKARLCNEAPYGHKLNLASIEHCLNPGPCDLVGSANHSHPEASPGTTLQRSYNAVDGVQGSTAL